MKRLFTALVLFLSSVTVSLAAYIAVDFSNFKPEGGPDFISPAELLSYVNSESYLNANNEKLEGVFSAIPVAEQAYGFSNGLAHYPGLYNNNGALFILSTDPDSKEDVGEVSFKINPKFQHKNTNLTVYGYIDSRIGNTEDGDIKMEISINGGEYVEITRTPSTTQPTYNSSFRLPSIGKVVREFSIRFPNPGRDNKTGEIKDIDLDFFFAITFIRLYYSDTESADKVTKWEFEESEHSAELENADSYVMPSLIAVPEAAAEYAVFTSSNPDVAEIRDNQVDIKGEGKTTISASLLDTPVFVADQSLPAASYELTVGNSKSTAVGVITEDSNSNPAVLYDINGRRVVGAPDAGIYIEVKDNKTRKIVVR